jgi:hypothetical protein
MRSDGSQGRSATLLCRESALEELPVWAGSTP